MEVSVVSDQSHPHQDKSHVAAEKVGRLKGSPTIDRVVILNDSSVAKGGATDLAILSAKMLRMRGISVVFISGGEADDGVLAAEGIEMMALREPHILDSGMFA